MRAFLRDVDIRLLPFFFIPIAVCNYHDAALPCLLLIFLSTGPKQPKAVMCSQTLTKLIGVFFLVLFMSCFWSLNIAQSLVEWLVLSLTSLLGVITLYQIKDVSEDRLIKIIHYSVLGLAVASILYAANLFTDSYFYNLMHGRDPASFNPEKYGKVARIFLMLYFCFLPIQFYYFSRKVVWGGYAVFALISIQLFQITNLLMLMMPPLVFAAYRYIARVPHKAWSLLWAGIISLMPFIMWSVYQLFTKNTTLYESDFYQTFLYYWSLRVEMWAFALEKISQNFLWGYGLESYKFFVRPEGFPNDPHNLALQIYLDVGLLGGILLGAVVYQIVKYVFSYKNLYIQKTAFSMFLSAFVVAMLYYPITREWWYAFLWLLAVYFTFVEKYISMNVPK